MAQLVQNQNLYPDPFSYFANTPKSITFRKHKALRVSPMKIINFTKNDDGSFIVSIKGVRGIPYQVFFSEQEITCSCPDYQKRSVKPICKHMFKCICLSENDDIFNNVMLLSDLMNPQYLDRILENIMRIIDIKKMARYGNLQNQISIERDEYCSICYGDFDTDIAECLECKHVFHQTCIRLSWNSASYLSRGKCPMCRAPNSFPQFGGFNNNDPWEIYNFPPPNVPAPPHAPVLGPEPAPEPAPEPELLDIVIGNPPVGNLNPQLIEEELAPEPAQQDILVVNPVNNQIVHIQLEQNDDAIAQNQLFFQISDDSPASFENGEGPNENLDPDPSPSPILSTTEEESSPSLSQEEEYEIIDTRLKVLNISLFILNTINIIVNRISTDLSSNPKSV